MIKCASSTLAHVFKRFGFIRNLSFVLPPSNKIYIGWPYRIDETLYRPKKTKDFNILCDHAVYDDKVMQQLMPAGTIYITSLREPFSQFKSMLNYYNVFNLSGYKPDGKSDPLATYLDNIQTYEATYKSHGASKERYCIPDGFSMTKNLMSFNLGFPTGFLNTTRDMSTDDGFVQKWLDEVSSKFTTVLFTENFYESMVFLRRTMCWSLPDILFRAANSLPYGFKAHSDSRLVEKYKQWSPIDFKLYERFNKSFHEKLDLQKPEFWQELANYVSVNKAVNEHCPNIMKTSRYLRISESPWNKEFIVNAAFCELFLTGDMLPQLKASYEQQLPKVDELKPSVLTC